MLRRERRSRRHGGLRLRRGSRRPERSREQTGLRREQTAGRSSKRDAAVNRKTMATRSYTSRHELEQYAFHPAVAVLVPVAAVLLDALLQKWSARLGMVGLPLIVTIFFAVARRNPISGTMTGALIGLFQDALTHQPLGIFGMAKSLIGYM